MRSFWGRVGRNVLLQSTVAFAALAEAPEPSQPTASLQRDPVAALQRGEEIVKATRSARRAVNTQLAQAKSERDIVKILCLSDKARQLEIARRSGDDRLGALRAAARDGRTDSIAHELLVLEALSERVGAIATESSECIGEEAGQDSEATLDLQLSPLLPNADPSSAVQRPFADASAPATFPGDSISPPPVVASPTD
jgi:hypothetical protein